MFPRITDRVIGLDIETYDPDIEDLGAGPRRDGYILGVGIATLEQSFYFSLEHPQSQNVNKEHFYSWLNDTIPDKTLIGANLLYDLDFLQYQKFLPRNKTIDVQYNEALINNEKFRYNLDSLCQEYLGETKNEKGIEEYALSKGWKGKPQNHLWKMPAEVVSPYCQADAQQALRIYYKQLPILEKENLMTVYDMECDLIPLMLYMRKVGVRIDEEKLEQLKIKYSNKIKELQHELDKLAGFEVNIGSNKDLEKLFVKFNLPFIYTAPTKSHANGQPCFNEEALLSYNNEISEKILNLRNYKSINSKFVEGLSRFIVNGRIHCQFNQLKGDKSGTVSGRFSSSNPNLQQMPGDGNEEAKKDIRGLFIPEENCDWIKGDQSQIEMRLFFHYAIGPTAEALRQTYIDNPNTDCYLDFARIGTGRKDLTKKSPERKTYKKITLGILYGMWIKKLCRELKLPYEEGKTLIYAYFKKMPALLETTKKAQEVAERRGYVRTILGRRSRIPDPKFSYVAFNRIDQGSAADLMKKSMLDAWKAGLFKVLKPHITCHDEMDVSKPRTKEGDEAVKELKYISENCIKFKIPIVFELESGKNWAELEKLVV